MNDAPPPPESAPLGELFPLLATDPPKVGDFWLDARLSANESGVVYTAHSDDAKSVMLLLLSEGAATDAAARQRLSGLVNEMHVDTVVARGGQGQDEGRLAGKFRAEDDDPHSPSGIPLAPWVALRYDATPAAVQEANRLLAQLKLEPVPQVGKVSGPDYRLHWIDKTAGGASRTWSLPWPGRYDRASWLPILISWLLMLLLATLAVLIAILLFQHNPPETPPPPVPTSASSDSSSSSSPQSGSPSSGSGSPSSGSGSPSSGSPSQSSGSGSPSSTSGSPSERNQTGQPSLSSPDPSGSQSGEPSPDGSQSASAGNSPTPNSKL